MRKWILLSLALAIVIAVVIVRSLSIPRETLTFQFVDALTGRPIRATAVVTEHNLPWFPRAAQFLSSISILKPSKPFEHLCPDGLLRQRSLQKHPRRQTRIICSSAYYQTAVLYYCDGTNWLDSLGMGGGATNYFAYSSILHPSNGMVTVPLHPFMDYPLR